MRKGLLIATLAVAIAAALFITAGRETTQKNAGEQGFKALASNLDTPWAIDFLPEGTVIFTERGGRVSIIDNGTVKIIGNIEVLQESESGLHGIAVDPDFEENSWIYLYYTTENGNRVARFTLNKALENETVLLDSIPNARFHDGGRIKFGPDGMLYITTGDATEPSTAQDVSSLAGKILRMKKDGSIPEDNPFGNYVYSYGHRNPQGMAWHPSTQELFASEHGPTRHDEINIIRKGANYGWPSRCGESEDAQPVRCYTEFTLAPAGIAFLKSDLYIAGLRGAQLRRISLGENFEIVAEEELFTELGRIREAVAHGGYLYIATSNRDGRGLPRQDDDRIIALKLPAE